MNSRRVVIRRGRVHKQPQEPTCTEGTYTIAFGVLKRLERFFYHGDEYVKVGEEAAVSFDRDWKKRATNRACWLPFRATGIVEIDRDMPSAPAWGLDEPTP